MQGEWKTPAKLYKKLRPFVRQLRREQTRAELVLWQALRRRRVAGLKFRRQQAIGSYIADFYCSQAQLVIEVDGESHSFTADKDENRDAYMKSLGLRVLRFSNAEVLGNLEGVVEMIREAGEET